MNRSKRNPGGWRLLAGLFSIGLLAAVERPNLVLIVADDLGWNGLGCYGSDSHRTPRLDAFAAEGLRFTQAYSASPVCTPTRASILTGRHPARLRMTIWRESAADRGGRKLLEPVARDSLPLGEATLAEMLRDAGYFTAHVGKWHLGRAESYPQPHGFRVNIGGTLWGAPQTFFYPYTNEAAEYFSDWRYVPDLEPGEEGDYLTDRLTDKALEAIDMAGERPFFLNLWYYTPHTPIDGKPERVADCRRHIDASDARIHVNPDYAAMVESLDENVGRVLDGLEERGLAEKTLVLFLSDNGGFIGKDKRRPGVAVTSNLPLRSGKGSCYEGGIRVPLIARGPGWRQGEVETTPVTTCDLLPTLLGRLGMAARVPAAVDGVDLGPLLDGSGSIERGALHFHFPHYYATTSPVSAIRVGDRKLIHYYEDDRSELYDLAADPGEERDLAAAEPELTARLRERLLSWLGEVEAQFPEPNPER